VQFLADESCDFAVVRALRAAGFDVVAVAEIAPRLTDQAVVEHALQGRRVVLTEDKDFGQLVYSSQRRGPGIILIRFPATARKTLPDTLLDLVRKGEQHIAGHFVVIQPGRVRIRRLPGDS
jgi:predicted nuclease of predicted toxin-antitoxin system